jgi:hypothetical protein
MKNPRIFAAVLFVVGFAILIANAAVYLGGFFGLSWEYHLPSSAIGMIFLVVGILQLRLLASPKPEKTGKTKKT